MSPKKDVGTMATCPYCDKEYNIISACTCTCPHTEDKLPNQAVCDLCIMKQLRKRDTTAPRDPNSRPGKVKLTSKEARILNSLTKERR